MLKKKPLQPLNDVTIVFILLFLCLNLQKQSHLHFHLQNHLTTKN